MANKMIDVNRHLFERLEKLIPNELAIDSDITFGDKTIRYIRTTKNSFAQLLIKYAAIIHIVKTVDKSTIFNKF